MGERAAPPSCQASSSWDIAPPNLRSWDVPDPTVHGDTAAQPENWGLKLVELLVELYFIGTLNARLLCTICWFAFKAGIAEARQYAMPEGAESGKYQVKLDAAFGYEGLSEELYTIHDLPMSNIYGDRIVSSIDAMPSFCTGR